MKIDPAESWLAELSPSLTFERATEINWLAYTLMFRSVRGNISSVCEHDHFRILTGSPTPVLNHVTWGGKPAKELSGRVLEITETLKRELATPNSTCEWSTVGSHFDRKPLEEALGGAGWTLSHQVPGMTCTLAKRNEQAADTSNFAIERMKTSEDFSEWLAPYMDGFSFHEVDRTYLQEAFTNAAALEGHPFHHYSLRYRGSVITTGSIQFRYGVAVIYNICTLTNSRKLGGATAMVSFLKNVAAQGGYETVSLFALEAGQKIYEKLGFTKNTAVTRTFRLTT